MTSSRLLSWFLLFVAVMCLTPSLPKADAFGWKKQPPPPVCVQQVPQVCVQQVPVYIDRVVVETVLVEKDCGDRRPAGDNPQVYFFLIGDTKDTQVDTRQQIEAALALMTGVYTQLDRNDQGEERPYIFPPDKLGSTAVLDELKKYAKKLRPQDTLFVYLNTHGLQVGTGDAPADPKPADAKPADPKPDTPIQNDPKTSPPKKVLIAKDDTPVSKVAKDAALVRGGQAFLMWRREGGKDPKAKTDLFGTDEEKLRSERMLMRDDVTKALSELPCRLKLLVSDSCFYSDTPVSGAPAGSGTTGRINLGPDTAQTAASDIEKNYDTTVNPRAKDLLKDLFFGHEGVLDLNSTEPSKTAVAGVFSFAFRDVLTRNPAYTYGMTWERFIFGPSLSDDKIARDLMKRVDEYFKHYKVQPTYGPTFDDLDAFEQKDQKVHVFPLKDKDGKVRKDDAGKDVLAIPKPKKWTGKAAEKSKAAGDGKGAAAVPMPMPSDPAVGEAVAPAAAPANFTVNLPADATLYWNGMRSEATGATRYFQTTPLKSGETAKQTFRIEAVMNGQKVSETKELTARSGTSQVVSFESPRPVAANPDVPAPRLVQVSSAGR